VILQLCNAWQHAGAEVYAATLGASGCHRRICSAAGHARCLNACLWASYRSSSDCAICAASAAAGRPGFDFNRCISQGVPYMPVRTRDFQLLQVRRQPATSQVLLGPSVSCTCHCVCPLARHSICALCSCSLAVIKDICSVSAASIQPSAASLPCLPISRAGQPQQ
jgi:hypothetical protein